MDNLHRLNEICYTALVVNLGDGCLGRLVGCTSRLDDASEDLAEHHRHGCAKSTILGGCDQAACPEYRLHLLGDGKLDLVYSSYVSMLLVRYGPALANRYTCAVSTITPAINLPHLDLLLPPLPISSSVFSCPLW